MDVREIVRGFLIANDYEGLNGDYCCCGVEDLMPCCEDTGWGIKLCEAGYKVPCDPEDCAADGNCQYHISTTKPEAK